MHPLKSDREYGLLMEEVQLQIRLLSDLRKTFPASGLSESAFHEKILTYLIPLRRSISSIHEYETAKGQPTTAFQLEV